MSHEVAPQTAGDVAAQALTPAAAPTPPTAVTSVPPIDAMSASSAADTAAQTLTPAATPSITGTPSVPAQATHAAPSSQVAQAVLTLATSTAGTQRLTLRLEPADLGTVQVRIDRPAEAPAHVDISVSRPETLTLMLRDQAQLQHTLDQAGVPAAGRTVSFHLAGQDTDSLSRQTGGFDHAATNGETTRNRAGARDAADPDDVAKLAAPIPTRWQRVGLDITA
jgi:flagellar hook-length control protein FliK